MAKIILRDENQVLKRAKINELEFGLRPDRKKIGRYRGFDYAEMKHNMNPLAGRGNVDLILTGAFSNSLFTTGKSTVYRFESGDPKAQSIQNRYGIDVVQGLNQRTFNTIQDQVYKKKLVAFIKTQLGQNAKSVQKTR